MKNLNSSPHDPYLKRHLLCPARVTHKQSLRESLELKEIFSNGHIGVLVEPKAGEILQAQTTIRVDLRSLQVERQILRSAGVGRK